MWQHLHAKILDKDDKDELYNRLLHPKMNADETPLEYKLSIEQALRAAKTKKLHISLCQGIRVVGNGVDPHRCQAIMDSYAIENKTFESLDKELKILEKFDKNFHVKASRKAQTKPKPTNNISKASTNAALTVIMTSLAPTLTHQEMKTLKNICKINKRRNVWCMVVIILPTNVRLSKHSDMTLHTPN